MISKTRAYAIYGFGRAGRSLSLSLSMLDGVQVYAYARSPDASAKKFAADGQIILLEHEHEFFKVLESKKCRVLFIAVYDDSIVSVAKHLSQNPLPRVVTHLSGVFPGHVLSAINSSSAVAQFHPLASLDGASGIPAKCLIAINSDDDDARLLLADLAEQMHCNVALLETGDQIIYHAAAVITGNLSLALVSLSQKLLEHCKIDKYQARIALSHLLKSAALALEENELSQALTGPLARGDEQTISRHLKALSGPKMPEGIATLYALLSNVLLQEISLPNQARIALESSLKERVQ